MSTNIGVEHLFLQPQPERLKLVPPELPTKRPTSFLSFLVGLDNPTELVTAGFKSQMHRRSGCLDAEEPKYDAATPTTQPLRDVVIRL
jgi:hypothetical protein